MKESIKAKGNCLCGAVGIEAGSMSTHVDACHCGMCRKWTGGPLMAVDCKSDVKISGSEYVSTFDSSEWAQRGFCSRCGSHLFYLLKQNNQYIIPAGLFETHTEFIFDHEVFIEEKPAWYSFSNQTKYMTGEELFALFSSE